MFQIDGRFVVKYILAMNIKLLKKKLGKKLLGLLFDDYIWFMFEGKEIIVKIGKKQQRSR